MKQNYFEVTLIVIASQLNVTARSEVKLDNVLGSLDLESYNHFDCTIYWNKRTANNIMTSAKFQTAVFATEGVRLNSTLTSPSAVTTTGFSVVFAVLSDLNETENFLQMAANLYSRKMSKEFWSPYFFLFLNSSSSSSTVLTPANLQNFASQFNIASEVYIILLNEEFEIKSIHEFYHIKKVRVAQDITTDLTVRDSEGRSLLSFWKAVHKTGRRSNFRQEVIVGVNVDSTKYFLETKYKARPNNNSKIEFESGFNVFEFWYLRDALNFSEVASTWPKYLKQGPNGTLTGLSVPINNGLADIRVGSTEFLEYRFSGPDGITYLHPTFYNEILVFFKQPSASSIRDIFFLTFSTEVWAVLMGTWCLIVTSLVTAVHLKRRTDRHSVHSLDAQLSRDVLVWSVSTICQQGWHISPISTSIRIIFLVGVLTALLSYIAYSAALVSILSVEVIPVRSFQDLLEYKFNIFSDNHIPSSKAVVNNLEHRGVIKRLEHDGRNVDVAENLPQLIKTKIAFVTMSDSFYQVLDSQGYDAEFTCSHLSRVPFSSVPIVSSFFVKRASPLRDYFNIKILLMKERGVMSILRDHYIRDTSVQCLHESSGFRQQLGSKDLRTAFVILGSGMSLGLFIGVMERIAHSTIPKLFHTMF